MARSGSALSDVQHMQGMKAIALTPSLQTAEKLCMHTGCRTWSLCTHYKTLNGLALSGALHMELIRTQTSFQKQDHMTAKHVHQAWYSQVVLRLPKDSRENTRKDQATKREYRGAQPKFAFGLKPS